jgi:hypothetical protein
VYQITVKTVYYIVVYKCIAFFICKIITQGGMYSKQTIYENILAYYSITEIVYEYLVKESCSLNDPDAKTR